MSRRRNPVARDIGSMPVEEDKHERMLSEMHDALYTLGSKIRKPIGGRGDKLLPKELAPAEPEGAKQARDHIESLHASMKCCK